MLLSSTPTVRSDADQLSKIMNRVHVFVGGGGRGKGGREGVEVKRVVFEYFQMS